MKHIFILLSSLFILNCCKTNKKTNELAHNKKIELLISKHRKHAFIDFYEKSIKQEEIRYRLKKCDSLVDLSASELYNENCLKIDFYSEDHPTYTDKNYDLLISKWLGKKYPDYTSPDDKSIKTTMTFKRALDFYESADLNKYLDSLRSVFYKKHENHNLKSIDCIN